MKIKKIEISNFRGITKKQNLDLVENKKSESILIYGDNGTGKSSFVDAIEFVTQGTVHGRRTTGQSDWIYKSKSKANDDKTILACTFDNEHKVEKRYNLDSNDKLKIETIVNGKKIYKNLLIPDFCHAPFVLRRKDIIDFWNLDVQERMRIFIPFSNNKENSSGYIPISLKEKRDRIEKRRQYLKKNKRKELKKICKMYNLDFYLEQTKSRDDVFKEIKKIEKVKELRGIKQRKEYKKYYQLRKLYELFSKIGSCNKDIKRINNEVKELKENKFGKFPQLNQIMDQISPIITSFFKKLSNASEYVKKIEINVAKETDVSINFLVILNNGKVMSPEKLFSEANRDLLALLIYFEFIFAKSETGQSRVLIMDDIFQSIDSTIRLKIMRYLINRFKDWQLIITTHDRLWKEQISQLFINYNKSLIKYDINNWSFSEGPILVQGLNNMDEKLKKIMKYGDITEICSRAGYLLEYLCDQLSQILHSGVQRKRNDRYTIGDLWPSILKIMRKTKAAETYVELNDVINDRNWVGDHFNEWALNLSREEAINFADLVLSAYYQVYYKSKGKWIRSIEEITGKKL